MSSSIASSDALVALYRQRVNDFAGRMDRLARRANRISHARVAAFLVAMVCFLAGALADFGNSGWFSAGAALLVGFVLLVRWHRRVLAESDRFGQLSRINRHAAERVRRAWVRFPVPPDFRPLEEEALSADLDLFGPASLFHLVSMANTPAGIATLGDWLLHPAEPDAVAERQQAVAELAPDLQMRQELCRRGLRICPESAENAYPGQETAGAARDLASASPIAPESPENVHPGQETAGAVRDLASAPPIAPETPENVHPGQERAGAAWDLASAPKNAGRRGEPGRFLQWAEAEPWLAGRHWLKWASWCLPLLIMLGAALGAAGVVSPSAWLVPFMLNVLLGSVFCRQIHEIFRSISTRHGEIGHYAGLFQWVDAAQVASPLLVRLQQQTAGGGGEAGREIRRLGRIMDLANLRFSSMAYFLIQSFTAWDFHILALLERWQRRNGQRVRRWFEALGEWEALASLANLAHDNPGWVFPTIEIQAPQQQSFRASSLGHPLIPDDRRVANDIVIGPPGTFLMVTGSNMSGKSTLLRAVGANVVLAQAGGPVCAERLVLPPTLLATSMRIHDSLAGGVSFYMAELKRLKQIVDAARRRPAGSRRAFLYLLDEILQGTNTAERQIAVRRVLAHLLSAGAIGAISTHDLQLAAEPELAKAGRAVHFRETIATEAGRPHMTFDYKLREGLATTSNALKLLEIVGLGDE